MKQSVHWKQLEPADLHKVTAIANQIHPDLPERQEIFGEKISLFSQGCKKLTDSTNMLGYAFSHPWYNNKIPSLDTFLYRIPEIPDCIYIHDVAILPSARGKNATEVFISELITFAKQNTITSLALVSVYQTTGFWKRYGFSIVTSPAINEQLTSYGNSARYMQLPIG